MFIGRNKQDNRPRNNETHWWVWYVPGKSGPALALCGRISRAELEIVRTDAPECTHCRTIEKQVGGLASTFANVEALAWIVRLNADAEEMLGMLASLERAIKTHSTGNSHKVEIPEEWRT